MLFEAYLQKQKCQHIEIFRTVYELRFQGQFNVTISVLVNLVFHFRLDTVEIFPITLTVWELRCKGHIKVTVLMLAVVIFYLMLNTVGFEIYAE